MMKKNPDFSEEIQEYIDGTPDELEYDAVGLWQIIPAGREMFGLEGKDLDAFVVKVIISLLDAGAEPVKPALEKDRYWVHQPQYGGSKEQIAENILSEWKSMGKEPNVDGLWFNKN